MLPSYSQAEHPLFEYFGQIPIIAAVEDLVRTLEHPALVRFA
jgi:hypothetical protein